MMGAELDPFANLRRLAAAGVPVEHAGDVDLAAELETMARRLAIGPLFLVHPDDETQAAEVLDWLKNGAGVDHRVTLRASSFVNRGTLLVITPEARAAAHDVGLTDDLLAQPLTPTQEGPE